MERRMSIRDEGNLAITPGGYTCDEQGVYLKNYPVLWMNVNFSESSATDEAIMSLCCETLNIANQTKRTTAELLKERDHALELVRELRAGLKDISWRLENVSPDDIRGALESWDIVQDLIDKTNSGEKRMVETQDTNKETTFLRGR
jgi:hypothetical protein